MSKKGFIDNIFLVIIVVLGFFGLILVNFIYGQVRDGLNDNALFANNTDVQNAFADIDTTNANQDWLFVLLFFGVVGAILITLYFLRSSPAFFLVGIIGLIVVVFLAIILRDVFTDVINSNADFVAEANSLEKSNYFFEYIPVIMLVIISVFLIFTYISKNGVFGNG